MPQVLLTLLIIYLVVIWVVPLIVFILQWITAGLVWVWQVFFLPFLIYFTPAIVILIIAVAMFWGSWIAVQNYFISVKIHVNPVGLEKLIKYYIIYTLTTFLAVIYSSFIILFLILIYQPGELFVIHVIEYYDAIVFPAFKINFPFWE